MYPGPRAPAPSARQSCSAQPIPIARARQALSRSPAVSRFFPYGSSGDVGNRVIGQRPVAVPGPTRGTGQRSASDPLQTFTNKTKTPPKRWSPFSRSIWYGKSRLGQRHRKNANSLRQSIVLLHRRIGDRVQDIFNSLLPLWISRQSVPGKDCPLNIFSRVVSHRDLASRILPNQRLERQIDC